MVTGISGSGKSSLINGTLYPILNRHFYRSVQEPLPYKSIEGIENIDKIVDVDPQSEGHHVLILQLIQEYLQIYGTCLQNFLKPKYVVINREDSLLM